ncbi:efflux RND transporter permease subunit [Gloeobacter morelensis]|uniref:Efflux RND transporter permease subunit n=1 Tax=Gloeobacter morelensis MG652769 TaxID=2781736 RepID=A0ABY3PJF8_9CYAN|nr:efflux RND transporter permease subunit [Gloeobacter morelensis]UFP93761.1 efflux RND transporter permease subunit [Gloeobacter morelensis MG652769]
MWIVRLALRRPYTFIVASLLVVLLGVVTIRRMATDILPEIDVPVVSVIWAYPGVSPEDMEKRVVTVAERAYTTTVNDIEHMESQSMNGVSVIKVFFQPGAKVEAAVAQLTSISQTVLRILPPGITPPLIIRYSAASVPVLQVGIGSKTLSEQELYDYNLNFVRTQLATVQGASIPLPYGGKPRQVMIDLDPEALFARGLSATDVTAAINAQNLILPAGTAKIGEREYNVQINSSPEVLAQLADLPIREVNGSTVYIRDVAQVRDGYAVQSNVVRQDGRRSSLLTVIKNGGASTLDVVERIQAALPRIQATLPPELEVKLLFDQSVFVRAAVDGVVKEALIAALLTGTMILLFLGSWRSTLIITISIPLSILGSIVALSALGQTLNVMTLGGLALAVGILVDDATVEIENIHRNLGQGKPLQQAILDGAQQIATPAFVSTLCICIVFVPVFFLSGAARSLFVPLGMAVVFAMLASYLLSRTLVPVLVRYLLKPEVELYVAPEQTQGGWIWRIHQGFDRGFERFRGGYRGVLAWALGHRGAVFALFGGFFGLSALLYPLLGQDFFPRVDGGQFRLHVRAPAGTRIEQTEVYFARVEAAIRRMVPERELALIIDNIGLPVGGVNLAFSDSATIGAADGEILVSLEEGHTPTHRYVERLRRTLKTEFPELTFFFQPSDIVTQILNFGLPAPIDVQVSGPPRNQAENYRIARKLEREIARIPGAADVHLHQIVDSPALRVNVDRTRAAQMGLSQRDVANTLLYSLASSGQSAPNYWLNPKNGVNYLVAVQTPQYRVNSAAALENTPITAAGLSSPQLLSNLASLERRNQMQVINHYNVQPTFNVYANVQNRDLGGVASEIGAVVARAEKALPRGSRIAVRGQVESMNTAFTSLALGLVFAIVLVYCLMVVNFQSWVDPLVIIAALPGALAGICWMLFLTQTTVSVPALMGAIMAIGVATANSILLVTFANDRRHEGDDATAAALAAGYTRLRPVLMTALAMILGMLPMALGFGEGGEQNAPLGRAVIGGLLVATFTTLFFVPVVYSVLRRRPPHDPEAEDSEAAESPMRPAYSALPQQQQE